jgi:radical SAM superfamily enzyme YgiQ (UPF0313 family)
MPMKIVLLQPPIQDFYETSIRLQPIGLCYLKAAVKRFLPGIEVAIKDYHQGWGRKTIPLPTDLAYLREFYAWPDQSPFSSFYHYYHFGASFETVGEDVARENPDLVGISSLFSPYYREVLRCAEEIKRRLDVPILVGGSHVSAAPQTVLEHQAVDFVIRGEGERPLVEFLKSWMNAGEWGRVPNLGFKRKGKFMWNRMRKNFQIDDLPFPDFSDFSPDRYRFEKRPLSFLITSRGCPYRCSFCSAHLTFGRTYRKRPLDDVIREITRRYLEGYRAFDFEEDSLVFDCERAKALCKMLINEFHRKDVQLLAMNGVSYLSLDTELLCLMREAGFTHLNLSVVSTKEEICAKTKRPHSLRKYTEVVEEALRQEFKIVSYQILGLPSENLETMIQTLAFNTRMPVLLGPSIFYLTPHTPISRDFPKPTETDILKSRLTAMAIETPQCGRKDLYTLFVTSRIINFLKGIRFEKEEIALAEALHLAHSQGNRSALGAKLLERLLNEKRLYAATKNGLTPLEQFRSSLFFRIWSLLGRIGTQQGKTIRLDKRQD